MQRVRKEVHAEDFACAAEIRHLDCPIGFCDRIDDPLHSASPIYHNPKQDHWSCVYWSVKLTNHTCWKSRVAYVYEMIRTELLILHWICCSRNILRCLKYGPSIGSSLKQSETYSRSRSKRLYAQYQFTYWYTYILRIAFYRRPFSHTL